MDKNEHLGGSKYWSANFLFELLLYPSLELINENIISKQSYIDFNILDKSPKFMQK